MLLFQLSLSKLAPVEAQIASFCKNEILDEVCFHKMQRYFQSKGHRNFSEWWNTELFKRMAKEERT